MGFALSLSEKLAQDYTIAINSLYEIARVYYFQGRLGDAQFILSMSLRLGDAKEFKPEHHLQLLLLYGQVLIADHLLAKGNADLMLSTIMQARQMAEIVQSKKEMADALSLQGQACYFATLIARLKNGGSPDSAQCQGEYDDALAYQQQALKLREELQDTRGISESYFQIGVIYERWQQYDEAQGYYTRARTIADQYNYLFEKTEPARHMAVSALRGGDLDQALTLALQALSLREEAGFKPYLPLDYLLLKEIYLVKGDTINAQLYYTKAVELAEEIGYPKLVASAPDRRVFLKNVIKEG